MHMKSCNHSWLRISMSRILNYRIKYTRQMPSLIQVFCFMFSFHLLSNTSQNIVLVCTLSFSWQPPWDPGANMSCSLIYGNTRLSSQLNKSTMKILNTSQTVVSVICTVLIQGKTEYLNKRYKTFLSNTVLI